MDRRLERETGDDPNEAPLTLGTPVLATDGSSLGRIADVLETMFRVEADHGEDFWLSKATIGRSEEGNIVLRFDKEQLNDLKMQEPVAAAPSPMIAEELNVFSSAEEQARKRQEMIYGASAGTSSAEDEGKTDTPTGSVRTVFEGDQRVGARSRRRWLWVVGVVVALSVLAAGVAARRRGSRPPRPVRETVETPVLLLKRQPSVAVSVESGRKLGDESSKRRLFGRSEEVVIVPLDSEQRLHLTAVERRGRRTFARPKRLGR
jgi:hypothetical protein